MTTTKALAIAGAFVQCDADIGLKLVQSAAALMQQNYCQGLSQESTFCARSIAMFCSNY